MAETRAAARSSRRRVRHGTTFTDRLERARIRTSFFLHQHVLSNRASRRSFAANQVTLNDHQRQLLSTLQTEGFAKTSFDQLIGDADLWAQLLSEMDAFTRDIQPKGKPKKYLLRRGGRKGRSVSLEDPWLRYATQPAILDLVNSYLRLHSKIADMDQWYTLPSPPGSDRIASQRWHRDGRDLNIVKVFTYFSDVDRDAGALEYVLGSPPGARHSHLWAWDPIDSDYHPSDEEVRSHVPESDLAFAEGPVGTIYFCNTTGLHRGGYASKPRVNSMFSYVSPASVATLKERRITVDLDGQRQDLPEATRFALS